jgi:serine/threonine-protein kinase HipA
MTYQPVDLVEVIAWGRRVGAVALDPESGWYAFSYDPEWVAGGVELAPVHMPLRTAPYEFPDLPRSTFFGLPALLADSLPDAFGNALVNAWMAAQNVPVDTITALDRLAYAADRAMGALEFRPPANSDGVETLTAIQLADLVVAARSVVRGTFTSEETTRSAVQQLIQVGSSAGGARPKAVVAYNPSTDQMRSAYDEPEPGFEQWIVKLDGVGSKGMDGHGDRLGDSAPYGRIEFAYSLMARAAGIDMTECKLLAEGPRRHFMTKRFDRGPSNERHHVLSLCAMAHVDFNMTGTHTYDQYFQTIEQLGLGPDAKREAFRRMAFNVMAVNMDDHTKNFSFLRRQSGSWELAPAFDVTHSYDPTNEWVRRHLMSVNGRFEDIGLGDLLDVGDRHEVPGFKRCARDVQDAVDGWRSFASAADVPDDMTRSIWADIERFRPR